jgi:hypothetical protein
MQYLPSLPAQLPPLPTSLTSCVVFIHVSENCSHRVFSIPPRRRNVPQMLTGRRCLESTHPFPNQFATLLRYWNHNRGLSFLVSLFSEGLGAAKVRVGAHRIRDCVVKSAFPVGALPRCHPWPRSRYDFSCGRPEQQIIKFIADRPLPPRLCPTTHCSATHLIG